MIQRFYSLDVFRFEFFGIESEIIRFMAREKVLIAFKNVFLCLLFLQLMIIFPAHANLTDRSLQAICQRPYETLCSSEEVRRYREEWKLYKEAVGKSTEGFLRSADITEFDKKLEQRQKFFKFAVFDKVRYFLESNSDSQRTSSVRNTKLNDLENLGLDSARLENKWSAHYSPQNSSIDLGYATFVEDAKFFPLVIRVAAHEFAHSVDPSAFYIRDDGSNGIFREEEYPFLQLLGKLNSIFPVGYDIKCLNQKKKLGVRISQAFLYEVKKNKYYKNNSLRYLGCGNGYASEAFSDYIAHKALLEGKNRKEIVDYVLQQAVHFCGGQKHDENDTHPSDRDRFENILFKIPAVKNAMGCLH